MDDDDIDMDDGISETGIQGLLVDKRENKARHKS